MTSGTHVSKHSSTRRTMIKKYCIIVKGKHIDLPDSKEVEVVELAQAIANSYPNYKVVIQEMKVTKETIIISERKNNEAQELPQA